jgi:hypothetical protein
MAEMATPSTINPMPAILGTALGSPTGEGAIHRDLHRIVSRAVVEARASGRDYLGQTDAAAKAVVAVRPDLTLPQAMLAVTWMREHVAG